MPLCGHVEKRDKKGEYMKKFLTLFLSIVLCLSLFLTACGGNTNSGEEDKTGGTESENPQKPNPDKDDDWDGTEYELKLEEGCRQLTIYYKRAAGYKNCDMWMWYGDTAGRGYEMHRTAYGAKCVINVPDTVTEVGFIIRTNCSDPCGTSWGSATKDGTQDDRFVTLKGEKTEIYTKSGDPNSYTSDDGGKTLKLLKVISLADLQDLTHLKINLSDNSKIASPAEITVTDDEGNKIAISSVTNNVATLASALDLSKNYKVTVGELDPAGIVPLTYFSSKDFEDKYAYDGKLGVELTTSTTTFRLWAPTASKVVLNIYDNGTDGTATTIDMTRGEKGLWSHTANENLAGKYYTYTVTTSMGTNEAVDPYAVSAGLNGKRGMILDLATTDPSGWSNQPFDIPAYENYTDAEIWEVHVRDFSNNISGSKYKGKYLAFTERGLTNSAGIPVGVDYLVNLGITHVHLQPTFDFASVDEAKNTDSDPDNDSFNWGYDPLNYNVPEGSYATNAADGAVRVREFKQMVQALHNAGIGVILDMVYNHTYSADSNFNAIVPYYYYRYTSTGVLSGGSGCGNETASERAMMRKFMVDSVTYWQTEYNVDGFRFDLMGLHDVDTMNEIRERVHKVNPKALIYGEGWTGGTSTNNYTGALLANIRKVNDENGINGIAMFNDVIRDGIKGSVFDIEDVGFATGASALSTGYVLFGANGGVYNSTLGTTNPSGWWSYNPTNVINYCSAHDNNTLWDRICHVYGVAEGSLNNRLLRNRLSGAIVQMSLGIPFMLAGEEMLRAKINEDGSYNENSYNSPDSVNNIDWDKLTESSSEYEMMKYYQGLIAFRKAHSALRQTTSGSGENTVLKLVYSNKAFVMYTVTDLVTGEELLVVFNGEEKAVSHALPEGTWNMYINGTKAGNTVISSNCIGNMNFNAISCYVFVKA